MGDYYTQTRGRTRGDFYYGDPGFFSFLKKAVSFVPGVGPLISSVIPGGKATSAIVKASAPGPIMGTVASATGAVASVAKRAGGLVLKHPVMSAAGAAGVVGALGGAVAGRMTGRHAVVGGRRRRRMNPCNPRALRRAIHRAQSFSRLAKKVLRFTSPKHHTGRPYFKFRKKRARV